MSGSSETLQPAIVCILGMHRSGTSLVTRMLNLMGVSLGPDEYLMQPTSANPKGYWEHNQIVDLNNEILRRLGGSWEEPPAFAPGWENDPKWEDLKQQARTLIQNSFCKVETWGWKDPRSCLTLGFWKQLLPEMRYVVCLRNPVDVAYSLERRDGFPAEKSSELWLTYVNSALTQSEGKPRLIVFYEDLVDDWSGQLERLADFLGKPALAREANVKSAVQEFVEKGLEHSRTSMVQAAASPMIAPSVKARFLAHRIALSLALNGPNVGPRFYSEIEAALGRLSQSSTTVEHHVRQLLRQVNEVEGQLAESRNTNARLQSRLSEQEQALEANSLRLAEIDNLENTLQQSREQLRIREVQYTQRAKVSDARILSLQAQIQELQGQIQELRVLPTQLEAAQSQTIRAEKKLMVVSAELLKTQAELKKVTDTVGWRLLRRYGSVKYRYLLPVYRLFGHKP